MSGEKNENNDLKAFEAALAALRPRTDRLDESWREMLAKEASLTAVILRENGPLSLWERVRVRAFGAGIRQFCASPKGHEFLCIHCGSAASGVRCIRPWALPTALAGMTTVAAILLIMLVGMQEPPVVSPSIVQQPANPFSSEKAQTSDLRLAMSNAARSPLASSVGEASYLKLREQVLRDGVESWKSPVSEVVTVARPTEAPLNYREQLQRLLEQQGLRGS